MDENIDPVYSRNIIEFVAVANEFCRFIGHASELKGDENRNTSEWFITRRQKELRENGE